jgi:TorA maturation chaperone TorD
MVDATVMATPSLDPEDQTRADCYALLARLYAAPPDAALLSAIAASNELAPHPGRAAGDALAQAWRALIDASAAIGAETVAAEYQDLFIGVGRSEVSLHASTYVKSPGDTPLVAMRTALTRLGLSRQAGVNLYEDHLAAVCETMRALITGAGTPAGFTLAQQRELFATHVQPWITSCCDAIDKTAIAHYYRAVTQFTRCFVAIERDSIALE